MKLAKKKQQESWDNAKKNHNVIGYMHHANLAVNHSNEIHQPTFWCYFDPHRNTTRMSNDPQDIKEESTTPVTIAPGKTSSKKIN